jgi:flagellar hook protein FlgE
MSSTTALFTGLSGLNANARWIEVTGNNISNANTTAFKSNRIAFETQIQRTLSIGTPPDGTTGGTNPAQIGLGVKIAGTQRDMSTGSLSPTGDSRDLAIEGGGFFIVDQAGQQFYTRAGNFRPNAEGQLTTVDGARLLGYGVDSEFNVIEGELRPVEIPIGTLTIAEATSNVEISGNLNADGDAATHGSRTVIGGPDGGLGLVSTATPPAPPGDALATVSRLVDIEDPLLPGTDTPLFVDGQSLSLTGVEKGDGGVLPEASLLIEAATTVQDMLDFFTEAFGIQDTGLNPDGAQPGSLLDAVAGLFVVNGNTGTVNDLTIETDDIRLNDAAGNLVRFPFSSDKQAEGDGESIRTGYIVYDSLGTQLTTSTSIVLESKSNTGTTWRFYADSADDTTGGPALTSGILQFDTDGQLINTDPFPVLIDRDNTGAATPMTFDLSFSGDNGSLSALSSVDSEIGATFRDGAPLGVLTDAATGPGGEITGVFTNGLTRTIGAIPLASFSNPEGLTEVGSNNYRVGANSGLPVVGSPGEFGNGLLVGGALELSNVDLSEEFINLILASTGYSASSRVIQTTNDLMQQLLVLGRSDQHPVDPRGVRGDDGRDRCVVPAGVGAQDAHDLPEGDLRGEERRAGDDQDARAVRRGRPPRGHPEPREPHRGPEGPVHRPRDQDGGGRDGPRADPDDHGHRARGVMERHAQGKAILDTIAQVRPRVRHDRDADGPDLHAPEHGRPGAIGPGMAVALITTMYGAIIANVIASPAPTS